MLLFLASCKNDVKEKSSIYPFEITELTDQQYPDNPDIGFRSENYKTEYFTLGSIKAHENGSYSINFLANESNSDTLSLVEISLDEFMPSIPNCVKSNPYLGEIALVNQEWNRNQVKFSKGEFKSSVANISRLDLARNCLNAYLWEVIIYTTEEGNEVPIAHGWFNFPKELYANIFEKVNDLKYDDVKTPLENWIDPKSKVVDMNLLREVSSTNSLKFHDLSHEMYPLEGARKKKFKEIIYPTSFKTMKELQSDSTLFATFTPPGFYNRADPRTTELGRFTKLDSAVMNLITSKQDEKEYRELVMYFKDGDSRKTNLVLGGLDFEQYPMLSTNNCNNGWKNSMGFGNHTFYEKYNEHVALDQRKNPYYAFLSNENFDWLDSHKIGIDGPVFHWDAEKPNLLHLWLLSFERHAFVGHYSFEIDS